MSLVETIANPDSGYKTNGGWKPNWYTHSSMDGLGIGEQLKKRALAMQMDGPVSQQN